MVDAVGDDIRVHFFGLRFEDDRELRRRARDAAFADAREKAEQFAVLAGRALGPVRSIDESGGQAYAVQTINRSSGPGPTPTPLGEQAVSVGLVVVFEFA
ncbi:MAG TPA: SIMPL domain-containing protein [Candidatus Dormibacteraeota bacterium]|nr:SIMPL domain-containing protein [Candidatus Dormibacteraeota bacterium]